MMQYLAVICFLAHTGLSQAIPTGNEVLPDQELVLAFVVNRHGERTPDSDELSLSNEKEKLKPFIDLDGLEGLTNVGKRRSYQIGKFLRQRYGNQGHSLLSNLYLQDEIAIRSTDKDRTKMTIQVAMAAVYPPESEQQWDEGMGRVWQPVPYTAVPLTEDYLRYYSNCQRFKTLMATAKQESVNEEFKQYDHLIPKLKALTGRNFTEDPLLFETLFDLLRSQLRYYSNCQRFKALMATAKQESVNEEFRQYEHLIPKLKALTGRNFTEDPLLFETLFDLLRSQVGLGLDIPEWAKPLLPTLGEAARLGYRLYFRTDEMKKLGGGVLLNDFMSLASDISSGKLVTKRLRIYSAHDFNIGALMDVSRVKSDQSIPEYGAVFALELYRSKTTGKLSVMPMYLPQAGESTAKPLHFQGCESEDFCSFDKFQEMTKEFLLPEKEFYSICNIRTEL